MQHCRVKLSTYYWMSPKSIFFFKLLISIQVFLLHTNFSLFFPHPGWRQRRQEEKARELKAANWNPIQFKGFGHCHNITHPSLTLPEPNKAHPSTGQSSPDLTHCKAYQPFATFPAPPRDSGTQLARGTNWIQSCSLQAKKWAIQPRTDGILCSVLLLPLPSPLISNPSLLILSLCCSDVKQARVLVEKATRQCTYWKLPGDKSTPGDGANGAVTAFGKKKICRLVIWYRSLPPKKHIRIHKHSNNFCTANI